MKYFLYATRKPTVIIGSPSESPNPCITLNPGLRKERAGRHQSVYDAVAGKSRHDRLLNPSDGNKRRKRSSSRAAPPESVLASRWHRQLKRLREEDDDVDEDPDDDVKKLTQAGLVVPSRRNEALPDSVCSYGGTLLSVGLIGGCASIRCWLLS